MAGIDKAAIVFSIAIALVGVGIAVAGSAADNAPTYTAPADTGEISEPETQNESFGADIAEKVKAGDNAMEKETVELEEKLMMEETHEEETMMEETMMEETMMEETMMEETMMEETMMEETMMEETMMEETMMEETMMEETHEEPAGPTTHSVDIPTGTSVPGCEESNACYSPADITINAGDTVEWINVDTAAHTVTGGSPADGPSGVFDSSLVMASANYAFTFDDAGSYDYFCMVHPWMVGTVTVN